MPAHTRRSPSQAKRFRTCHGSLAVCSTLPLEQQNVAGEAAMRGTCVHKMIEHCLFHGTEPGELIDRIIVLEGEDLEARILKKGAKAPRGDETPWFIVDSSMVDGAAMMVNYVHDRCFELGLDSLSRKQVQLESRTNPLPDRDDTSGTADVTLDAYPELIELADYKNGYNLVEHKDNDQLRAYLLGKVLESKGWHGKFPKRAIITVVQPNAPYGDIKPSKEKVPGTKHPREVFLEHGRIRRLEYTIDELLEFQKEYRTDIKKCEEAENDPRAPKQDWEKINPAWAKKYLKATEEGCFFCDARPVCPARKAMAQEQARIDFDDLPPEDDEELAKERKPSNLAEAEKILRWAPAMENLIVAANNYVQRALIQGGKTSKHFKVVRGRSVRELKNEYQDEPDKLAAAMVKAKVAKVTAADLMQPPKMKSGPQIESLVPNDKRDTFNAQFLFKPEGRLTLAPADDPRPAVEVGAKAAFKDDVSDFEDDNGGFG